MTTATDSRSERRRTIAMTIVALAFVMDILDLTIVNVAIPTIQTELGAGRSEIQWMVAGYATIFAVLLVTGGRLGDIFGYRRLLLLGAAGFTLSSLACGLAPNGVDLVGARLMQGAAAAMMIPQVMSLVQLMYAPYERAGALGIFGILGGTAAVAGPIIGGLLIGADIFGLGWRPIFLVNIPVGLVILVVAPQVLPATRSALTPTIDWVGVLLMTLGAFGLIFPLIEGATLGWPSWLVAFAPGGAALLAALALHSRNRERRGRSTLVPFAILGDPVYRLGLPLALAFQGATASLLFILSIILQEQRHFTSVQVAIVHIPYALGASVAIGLVARKLFMRLGARLVLGGAVLMGVCLILLALLLASHGEHQLNLFALGAVMLGLGTGMGLVGGPLTPITLARIPVGVAGSASGLLKTVQEFGGAVGVSIVAGVYFIQVARYPLAAELAALLVILLLLGIVVLLSAYMLRIFEPPRHE